MQKNKLLWEKTEIEHLLDNDDYHLLIDKIDDDYYLAVNLAVDYSAALNAELVSLRSLLTENLGEEFRFVGLGSQLLNWYLTHRYCGSCGGQTEPHPLERALICKDCEAAFYPRINPCVIVLVSKGDRLLLARNSRFPAGFYSCLAGFIEVGETPEQTVVREVREEVGIEVKNIQYIKSQSWPFPSQLMLGFFAEYATGHLKCDHREIEAAEWFSINDLPNVPSNKISVAGELIALYREANLPQHQR
jgi:NAD+ diphosphatase